TRGATDCQQARHSIQSWRSLMQLNPVRRIAGAFALGPLIVSACLGSSATPPPASPSSTAPSSAPSVAAPSPSAAITGTVTFWNGYAADGDEIKTFTGTVVPAFNK